MTWASGVEPAQVGAALPPANSPASVQATPSRTPAAPAAAGAALARVPAAPPGGFWETPATKAAVPATPTAMLGDVLPPSVRHAPIVVAPRARRGLRFYDLVLTDETAVLVRTGTLPAEWLGFFLGWILLNGFAGWFMGSLFARQWNPHRTAGLRAQAERLASLARPEDVVPYVDVQQARFTSALISTRLRVKRRGGRTVSLVWSNHQVAGVDLEGAVSGTMGARADFVRHGPFRRVIDGVSLGVLLFFITAILVSRLVFWFFPDLLDRTPESSGPVATTATQGGPTTVATPPPDPNVTAALAEARGACSHFSTFITSLGDRPPLPEELVKIASEFAPRMEAAAAKDPTWAPTAQAARTYEAQARSIFSGRVNVAEFEEAGRVIDLTCGTIA